MQFGLLQPESSACTQPSECCLFSNLGSGGQEMKPAHATFTDHFIRIVRPVTRCWRGNGIVSVVVKL